MCIFTFYLYIWMGILFFKSHLFLATFVFLSVLINLHFNCYFTQYQQLIVDINRFVFERKAWVQLQELRLRLFSLWEMQLCFSQPAQLYKVKSCSGRCGRCSFALCTFQPTPHKVLYMYKYCAALHQHCFSPVCTLTCTPCIVQELAAVQ